MAQKNITRMRNYQPAKGYKDYLKEAIQRSTNEQEKINLKKSLSRAKKKYWDIIRETL